jgi:hypothetical protein
LGRLGLPYGRANTPGIKPVAAAAQNPRGALGRALGIGRLRVWIRAIPVAAPLGHVAVHVVEPPNIRFLLGHRVRLIAGDVPIPRIGVEFSALVAEVVPELVRCCR